MSKDHGGPSAKRNSHEERVLQKQTAEVSKDQKKYLDSQGVIAEKPLKKLK